MERPTQESLDLAHQTSEWLASKVSEIERTTELTAFSAQAFYQTALRNLVEVRDRCRDVNRKVTLDAVRDNDMTRREAAQILGVHPITISRWLTAAAVEAPQET